MDVRQLQSLLLAKGIRVEADDMAFDLIKLNEVVLENIQTGTRIDIAKMRNLLLQKGIRVAADDPIFSVLAINGVALENLARKHKQAIERACAQRLSDHSENFRYLKILFTATGVACAFFVGMVVGEKSTSHFLVGTIGVVLGAASGWIVAKFNDKRKNPAGDETAATANHTPDSWTETDFNQAVADILPQLSSRVVTACRRVLLDRATVAQEAAKEKIFPAQIERALDRLATLKSKRYGTRQRKLL